jgi:hypothetical protein
MQHLEFRRGQGSQQAMGNVCDRGMGCSEAVRALSQSHRVLMLSSWIKDNATIPLCKLHVGRRS